MYGLPITRPLGFGEVLRGHRRAARLTLEQLAEVSGVSARTVSDMERGRSKGPQRRTVIALADALALEEDARKQLVELARDGRLRDHWTRPAGLCELPRLVDDFTGRAAELVWMSELVYAERAPGAGVVGLITGSGGMGKTTLAIRAAHMLRPSFPGGVFFLDLFGMSPRPAAPATRCGCCSARSVSRMSRSRGMSRGALRCTGPAVVAAVISQAAQGLNDQR